MKASGPMHLHWLDADDPQQSFPDVALALIEPDGLLAAGGDLSVTRLLRAYPSGIFPWFNADEPILWWSPNPRVVFEAGQIKLSRSLRKSLKKADYAVCFDRAFEQVLHACAAPREGQDDTWLGSRMREAYLEMHRRGYAHSVEVYRHGELIGGLYGLAIGQVFFGESMFSRANDGSKIALAWLHQQLQAWNFQLIDCQVGSEHLFSLGAFEISRPEFTQALKQFCPLASAVKLGRWQFELSHPHAPEHFATP